MTCTIGQFHYHCVVIDEKKESTLSSRLQYPSVIPPLFSVTANPFSSYMLVIILQESVSIFCSKQSISFLSVTYIGSSPLQSYPTCAPLANQLFVSVYINLYTQ